MRQRYDDMVEELCVQVEQTLDSDPALSDDDGYLTPAGERYLDDVRAAIGEAFRGFRRRD